MKKSIFLVFCLFLLAVRVFPSEEEFASESESKIFYFLFLECEKYFTTSCAVFCFNLNILFLQFFLDFLFPSTLLSFFYFFSLFIISVQIIVIY